MAPDDGVERDIVGRVTGDPPVTQDGDSWYNGTTNKLRAQQNGVISDMIGTHTPNLTGAAYAVVDPFTPSAPDPNNPVIAPPKGLLVLDTSVPDFTGYPTGPTGPTGPIGPTGATGATGATGPVGPVPEAPNNLTSYVRQALGWTNTPTFASPVIIGQGSVATSYTYLTAAAGSDRAILFMTGGTGGGNLRWIVRANSAAESGSNVGTDFVINRYSDTGVGIDAPFQITRQSGTVTIGQFLVVGGAALAGVSQIAIASAAGQIHGIWMSSGGANRWDIVTDGASETGSNAGSNFSIGRHSDAGPQIDAPFSIARATGAVSLNGGGYHYVNASGATPWSETPITGHGGIRLNKASGFSSFLSGSVNGVPRWNMNLGNTTAETGSNVGSDFQISRNSDAGGFLDVPFLIYRSTGQANFSQPINDTRPDVGRNKCVNPLFRFALRGTGNTTVTTGVTYSADRWWASIAGTDTATISTPPANDATTRAQIGDEEVAQVLQLVFTGVNAAANLTAIGHRAEGVRRFSGKTITISFWAWASSAGMKVGVSVDQIFGSGGSPSANVNGNGQAVTLANSWNRYSVTYAVPSAIGKTFGTNNDDSMQILWWLSSGSNNATRAGSIGAQSGTYAMWGVQIEIGSVMTPLEKPDFAVDLNNCQRFYKQVQMSGRFPATAAGQTWEYAPAWVPMRGIPTTSTFVAPGNNLATSASLLSVSASGCRFSLVASGAGDCYSLGGVYALSADI